MPHDMRLSSSIFKLDALKPWRIDMPQPTQHRYQCPDCHKPLFEDHVHRCKPVQTVSSHGLESLQIDRQTKFQLIAAEKKSDALLQLRV
jgi:hypothetical protein